MANSNEKSKLFNQEPKETITIKYRECWRNHAILIGGYAVDGCGEFIPKGDQGTKKAFLCEACDCHRNFHRKELIKNGKVLLSSHRIPPPICWEERNAYHRHHHHHYLQNEVQDMVSDEESFVSSGSQGEMEMKAAKRT